MVLGVLVRRLQTLKNVLTQRPPSAQPILVARFLMNLREADANQAGAKLMQSSKCSALEFRRRRRSTVTIIDAMAQTLEMGNRSGGKAALCDTQGENI